MSASRSQSNDVSKEVMTAAGHCIRCHRPMLDSTMINIAIKQQSILNSP